jgi:exonuclease SbcC
MKFKKISLKNIRSYKNAEIEFPEGSILLSGDIGSGKSSILLAIEFALFGLQRGKSGDGLLRNGEKEGQVKLSLELEGKNIVIERNLKKSKDSVQQDDCFIEINNEKKQLSANELKSMILNLFNYPSEFLQKNPILYRYTVYTQQEDMKSILLEEPDERLNTLRRVFNIDKYKRIIENTEKLMSKIREEIRVKEGKLSNLESQKSENELKKQDVVKIKTELATLTIRLNELKKIISERKERLNEFENKIKEFNMLKTEAASVNSELFTKKERINYDKEHSEMLKKQISAIENELRGKKIEDIGKAENEIKRLEKEAEEHENEMLKINRKITSFEVEKQRLEKMSNDIIRLQNCPTCQQSVSEQHKHEIKEKSGKGIEDLGKNLAESLIKKKEIDERLRKIKVEISALRIKDRESGTLKLKFSNLEEKKSFLKKYEESHDILEKSVVVLGNRKEELDSKIKEYANLEKNHDIAKRMFDEVKEDEKEKEISKARFERQLEDILAIIVIMEREIEEMEKAKIRIMKMSKLKSWLETEFIPSIINIEKNVMIKLHADFSDLFGKWFSMLVNDLNARINEEFTPIIEQSGYEIEYPYLSGGERTAAALAYRLALNQIVNSILSNIKTRDILILDEPTDGFSSEQLDRMRNVLDELKAEQLIIVSHEQKIESFVDKVIRINKDEGITRIN